MPQFLRPASDVTTTNWVRSAGTNAYFTYIDETTADDTDFLSITANTTSVLEVGVNTIGTTVVAPQTRTAANHIVRTRAWAVGSGAAERHTILLLQGTTTIATVANNLSLSRTAGTAVNYTLTQAEANSIVDYGNLRLRFKADTLGASEIYRVSWAEMEIPDGFSTRDIIIS